MNDATIRIHVVRRIKRYFWDILDLVSELHRGRREGSGDTMEPGEFCLKVDFLRGRANDWRPSVSADQKMFDEAVKNLLAACLANVDGDYLEYQERGDYDELLAGAYDRLVESRRLDEQNDMAPRFADSELDDDDLYQYENKDQ